MHGRRRSWLDGTMLFLTQLGNGIFAMILATLLYFGVLRPCLCLYLRHLIIMVCGRTDKNAGSSHPTPIKKIENSRIVGSPARGSSFPSGHTSQSFFMATFLLPYFHVNFLIGLAGYLLAFLVGITGSMSACTTTRDVLGGAMLGTAWGLLGVILIQSF